MPKPRPLRHAPLVEALLEIKVEPSPTCDLTCIERAAQALAPTYRRQGDRTRTQFEVTVSPDQDAKAKAITAREGLVLRDQSEKRVVQLTLGAFTQNILKPYSTFENLVEEARRNWQVYVDVARPKRVLSCELRYINDLRLPLGPVEPFEHFMPFVPSIPAEVSQLTSDFATRMTIHDDAKQARAVVSQLYQGGTDDEGLAQVFLDIHAISDLKFDVDDKTMLWRTFDTLREFKNEIFFSYTSEALLERYQ